MESVAVPIPSGTLKPEMHNIVAPISRFIPAPCHKPGPELSKANAVYKPQQSWLSGRAQNSQAVDQSSHLK